MGGISARDPPTHDLLQSVAPPDVDDFVQGRDTARGPNHRGYVDGDNWEGESIPVRSHRRDTAPDTPPDPPPDPLETAIQALWATVDQLARKGKRTVQHCGSAIRMEVARTLQKELPYHPLLAYMDEESIQQHVYPWQQVLTSFARPQAPHDWRSPAYDFTPRQRQKWEQLWAAVQVADVVIEAEEELQPWVMTAREQACLEFCLPREL